MVQQIAPFFPMLLPTAVTFALYKQSPAQVPSRILLWLCSKNLSTGCRSLMKDVACKDRAALFPTLVVSSLGTCCPQVTAVKMAA